MAPPYKGVRMAKKNKLPAFYTVYPTSYTYNLYLTGEIEEIDKYIEWLDILNKATEDDLVNIYINSGGGLCSTEDNIISAMHNSAAHICTIAEGRCMSAAAGIFVSGDSFQVNPHCMFMIHNFSGGAYGKGLEIHLRTTFLEKWSKESMFTKFSGFLTEDEIYRVLKGEDIYLTGIEVGARAENLVKYREEMYNEQNKDEQQQSELLQEIRTRPNLEEK